MKLKRLTKAGVILITCVCVAAAGSITWVILAQANENKKKEAAATATPSSSPTPTATPTPTPTPTPSQVTVSSDLDALITSYFNQNGIDASDIGIYVHDLTSGGTYTFNETDYFLAASTYKLPLAMYYYEQINAGKISPDTVIGYTIYPDTDSDGSTSTGSGSDTAAQANIVLQDDTTATPVPSAPAGSTAAAVSSPDATPSQSTEPVEEPTPEPTPQSYYDTVGNFLHSMILYSSNEAAEALYENIGGWMNYKELTEVYSTHITSSEEAAYLADGENMMSPVYMNDVLSYLYEHKSSFQTLISDMTDALPYTYLNGNVNGVMAQKYGNYGGAFNSVGFSISGHPYSIVIYTYGYYNGISIIGDVNEICYNYFNK